MSHKSHVLSKLHAAARRTLRPLQKLPKDFTILVITFSIIFIAFGVRDILDYSSMPPAKTNLEDVYGYYEPKRLQATVLKYRKHNNEPSNSYSAPSKTILTIVVDKISDINDADAIATVEGRIFADWDENSVQDYQNAGNQLEANAKSNIFSVLKLNFASQEEKLFRAVWSSEWKENGIKIYRALHEFKGLFKIAQDYRKFPFDTSKAIIEISTDLNSADIHLESDIASSDLKDPEWRVNSYYYSKNNCNYPKDWKLAKEYYSPQYYCVEDEFKDADPIALEDFIEDKKLDDNNLDRVLSFTPVVTYTTYLSRAPGSSFFAI